MFFQESTPDTSGYMIAGYTISFIVMALYVVSIYLRTRNLHRDKTMLEELEEPVPPVQASPKSEPHRMRTGSESNRSGKPVTKRSRKK